MMRWLQKAHGQVIIWFARRRLLRDQKKAYLELRADMAHTCTELGLDFSFVHDNLLRCAWRERVTMMDRWPRMKEALLESRGPGGLKERVRGPKAP